uniref:Uncharacterized protein n=1 Tax=Rhizophagus irregularis (strain DAOM 181602 / DAOM 197198 / MUCL 43194) TaxID=747089 RepID=U9SXP4_RHIID
MGNTSHNIRVETNEKYTEYFGRNMVDRQKEVADLKRQNNFLLMIGLIEENDVQKELENEEDYCSSGDSDNCDNFLKKKKLLIDKDNDVAVVQIIHESPSNILSSDPYKHPNIYSPQHDLIIEIRGIQQERYVWKFIKQEQEELCEDNWILLVEEWYYEV